MRCGLACLLLSCWLCCFAGLPVGEHVMPMTSQVQKEGPRALLQDLRNNYCSMVKSLLRLLPQKDDLTSDKGCVFVLWSLANQLAVHQPLLLVTGSTKCGNLLTLYTSLVSHCTALDLPSLCAVVGGNFAFHSGLSYYLFVLKRVSLLRSQITYSDSVNCHARKPTPPKFLLFPLC